MKGFAVTLLCALVAVQGRNTGLVAKQADFVTAALGENPWIVHLRVALSSGALQTCTGSLMNNHWVLTAADCVTESTFVWIRYGVVNVYNPELVTESNQNAVQIHPKGVVALLGTSANNRYVEYTENIGPVGLSGVVTARVLFCGFGADYYGGPGIQLSCAEMDSDNLVGITPHDEGSPILAVGKVVGIIDSYGGFVPIGPYVDWINKETSLDLA